MKINKAVVMMGSVLMVASAATYAFAAPQDTTKTTTEKKKKSKKTTGSTATTATTATTAPAPAAKMTTATTATTAPAAKMTTAKASGTQSAAQIADAKGKGQVWVNTGSGNKAYHKPDSKYYGNTKEGKWMSEADAQKAGYHLAGNEK